MLEFSLFCVSAVSRMACGAAVDRHENDRQRNRAVFKFLDTTKDRRTEEESKGLTAPTADYGRDGEDGEEYDDDYYEEYEDGMSGDYEVELPQGTAERIRQVCRAFLAALPHLIVSFWLAVAMSSKPKDPSVTLEAERTEPKRRRGKGRSRGKGKGKKRNPCLKKYKDFCIHGTCQYLSHVRAPSCV